MSLVNNCLSCGAILGRGATKCRCGWTATTSDAGVHLDCFNAPHCTKRALIRTDKYSGTKGRFQDFCLACEFAEHRKKSEKFCMDNGLISTQQKVDFCRAMAKKMFPGVTFCRQREPGDDDEQLAA
jgi:hypothetical protein